MDDSGASEGEVELWNLARRVVVQIFDKNAYQTFAHCLLQGLEMNAEEDARCWSELQEILHGCARGSTTDMNELLVEPSSASWEAKRANACLYIVAALADWVNMHGWHRPYAMGSPDKEQCCAVNFLQDAPGSSRLQSGITNR